MKDGEFMIKKTLFEIIELLDGKMYLHSYTGCETVKGIAIDSRKVEKNNIYFAIVGENNDGHNYIKQAVDNGAGLVVLSDLSKADNRVPCLLVEDTTLALKEMAEGYRHSLDAKIISITGSNGKTSTKDMLASVLSTKYKVQKTPGNYNNEFGVPLTILSFDDDVEIGIVEIGMEKLGDILYFKDTVAPDIGIVTNVGCAHLTTFKTMENIGDGKMEMMDIVKENGTLYFNGDDQYLSKAFNNRTRSDIKVVKFGESQSNDLILSDCSFIDGKLSFKVNNQLFKLNALGKHQAMNATPIVDIAMDLGISIEDINTGLIQTETSGMRDEINTIKNMIILNDAYKSNPQSALAALSSFESIKADEKIVVFADMLDLGPNEKQIHYDLGKDSLKFNYDEILLYGPLSYSTYEAIKDTSDRKCQFFENKEDIINYLKDKIDDNIAVLVKGSRGMKMDEIIERLKGEK